MGNFPFVSYILKKIVGLSSVLYMYLWLTCRVMVFEFSFQPTIDLYDFSQTPEEGNSFALKPKTGSVAKVNNTKIALFRFGDVVHAIDEKCPHLGKNQFVIIHYTLQGF